MSTAPALTVEDLHRLNRLLAEGLEREGSARTARLEALGEDDRHLRAVLVDLLNRSGMDKLASRQRPCFAGRASYALALNAAGMSAFADRYRPLK